MYANLSPEDFIKALIIADSNGQLRLGRTDGVLDYVCIFNTDTPECIDFEFVIGRGAQWVADKADMLKGFKYFILNKRGVRRKHKIQPHWTYGSSK